MSRPDLLFVLTDGGRARLVTRAPDGAHYVTVEEIDNTEDLRTLRGELRASPPVRVFSSHDSRRSAAGPEDHLASAKEAFMAEVADRAVARLERDRLAGVFLAAPPRLIGVAEERLDGRAPIVGTLTKDLTKAPEHTLGEWLDEAARAPQLKS